MILNRISTLWLNTVVAIVNVVVLTMAIFGYVVPPEYVASIDAAAAAIIALIANAQMEQPASMKLARLLGRQ